MDDKIKEFKQTGMELNTDTTKKQKQDVTSAKVKRGFACLTSEVRKEIARKGGKAAHQKGVAHKFNSEEARNAGKKGGTAVSMDRAHMASIGRKGGKAAAKNKNNKIDE